MPVSSRRLLAALFLVSQLTLFLTCDASRFRGFSYEDRGDSVAIVSYDGSQEGEVFVPGEIDGKPVSTLAYGAFPGTEMDRVVLPENMTTIENGAFLAPSMRELVLPSTLSTIESGAFQRCESLYEILAHPDSVYFQSIEGALFTKDGTELVLFPPERSFGNEGYSVPSGVTILRDYSFSYTRAEKITLPEGVTSIGSQAFFNSRLMSLNIPGSVETIDPLAFWNASLLGSIEVANSNSKFSTVDGVLFSDQGTVLRLYPRGIPASSYSIPDGVIRIATLAFNRPRIAELIIPSSVEVIEENGIALIGSTINVDEGSQHFASQEGVLFSADLTELVSFPKESLIVDYEVPASVTRIAPRAFYFSNDLFKVTLPEGLTSIGDHAFHSCRRLSIVSLPSTLLHIENDAFRSSRRLNEISLPDGLQTLGPSAFSGCGDIEIVTIPEGITALNESVFRLCTGLRSVSLPSTLTVIGDDVFNRCRGLVEINFPASLERIGSSAFSGCSGLSQVELPDTVVEIGMSAFSSCSSLTSFSIPPNLKRLEDYTFSGCFELKELMIPAGIEFIGNGAFRYTNNLEMIQVDEGNEFFINDQGALYSKNGERLLLYFSGSPETSYTISPGVKYVDDFAFYSNELESISLPEGVITLGESVFAYSGNLSTIELSETLTYLGENAFQNCGGLETIRIPSSLPFISNWTFYNCESLGSVAIPASVEWIGDQAFRNCYVLEDVEFSEGLKLIGNNAFVGCFALGDIILPVGLEEIQQAAFKACSFQTLDLPEGLLVIRNEVFADCAELSRVSFPDTLEKIGARAFESCKALEAIELGGGLREIGVSAFQSCWGLTSVLFPETVDTIDESAFAFSAALKEIVFWGDAPVSRDGVISDSIFDGIHGGAIVYHFESEEGFTSPTWAGVTTQSLGVNRAAPLWKISNGLSPVEELDTDPFETGSPLLANYAMNVDARSVAFPEVFVLGGQLNLSFFGDREDVTYVVELSKDLVSWSSAGVTISLPDDDGLRTATSSFQEGRCFVRLRFIQ